MSAITRISRVILVEAGILNWYSLQKGMRIAVGCRLLEDRRNNEVFKSVNFVGCIDVSWMTHNVDKRKEHPTESMKLISYL